MIQFIKTILLFYTITTINLMGNSDFTFLKFIDFRDSSDIGMYSKTTKIEDRWIEKVELLKDKFYISIGTKNVLYDEKSEGVKFSIKESDEKILVLSSFKEGYLSRYRFHFIYSKKEKVFNLYKVYFLNFSESCGHGLNAIYEVKNKLFENITLMKFDEKKIYQALYEKPIWINKEMKLYKIQSLELLSLYNEIFKLYKNKNIKFKEYVGDLLDKECNLKYYLNKKYFFIENIKLSNNIAFFFEQAGYYKEAIYLLKKILEKYPNRTVAHYNLADASTGH